MESAALALLTLSAKLSCFGVMFGWQPMPDDSNKVEYIVQIEPELAATLREGQAIPITSEIPDNIGPIGRIRIEVGRDELPRQSLATRFKPWPVKDQGVVGKESRDGIVETQFTAPADSGSRYGSGTNRGTILPPGGNQSSPANALGQALQQGVADARNAASSAASEILPPSSDQLFGSSNDIRQGLQNAVDNTRNSLRDGMQRGVRQVADRTGQQLRQAVNNAGQNASSAANNFAQSLNPDRSILTNQSPGNNLAIMPPGVDHNSSTTSNPTQIIKNPNFDAPLQPGRNQPRQDGPALNFAATSQPGANPTSEYGDWSAFANTSGAAAPPANNNSGIPSRYSATQQPAINQSLQQPANQNTNWPQHQNPSNSYNTAGAPTNASPANNVGYNSPGYSQQNPNLTNQSGQASSQASSQQNYQQRSGPGIGSNVAAGQPANMMPTAGPFPSGQQQVAARQPLDSQRQANNWDPNQQPRNMLPGDNQNGFYFGRMFVALCAAIVGFVYSYWSYLDVRTKYRGLVHGSSPVRDRYAA